MPMCVLFVSSRSDIVVNTSSDAITDHNQSAKDIDPYLSPSSIWRTPATESRYSFYRMGPESERMIEIKFPLWVGFEPTTS